MDLPGTGDYLISMRRRRLGAPDAAPSGARSLDLPLPLLEVMSGDLPLPLLEVMSEGDAR